MKMSGIFEEYTQNGLHMSIFRSIGSKYSEIWRFQYRYFHEFQIIEHLDKVVYCLFIYGLKDKIFGNCPNLEYSYSISD